ncbi:hypothetical protein E4U17_004148 [Claviceps sp. LM77 group G4]|nr:hypothetical protein E4U17_004148 [Claviceps sp. LM77 group G4]KAG6070491.1 hypothetical protein E4U33_004164 [Claviceps sp. LM78 group G4]KAG6071266.1 hypothetical protein E4U16_006249 [Claviceps sp. LM84 group G4]
MVSKTSASKSKTKPPPKNPKRARAPPKTPSTAHRDAVQSPQDQQILLDIFSDAFSTVLSSDRFPVLLQEIKQALYQREFSTAFGNEAYLEAYAARWSPTRALCYASIFMGIQEHLDGMPSPDHTGDLPISTEGPEPTSSEEQQQISKSGQESQHGEEEASGSGPSQLNSLKMLCIGGCAAEHVAFASYIQATNNRHGHLTLLDSGPWAPITTLLQNSVISPPALSKYASAAVRDSNKALLDPNQLHCAFTQENVLDLTKDQLAEVVGSQPQIVTLLFTLNELYTGAGIGKTTTFLRTLGSVLPAGSLLLVVDSPGSYSEAAVGKEKKKYPMQWLLDHTLLQSEEKTPAYTWERLESHDSLWFRLPEELRYPIPLESMRYQLHLYRLDRDASD